MKNPKEGKIYSVCYQKIDAEIYKYIVKYNEKDIIYYSISHDPNGIKFKKNKEQGRKMFLDVIQKYLEDPSEGIDAKHLFLTILFRLK